MFLSYRKNKVGINGFSLIEMLVVIAVIAVIAAIAVPQVGRIEAAAEEAKARRTAHQISSVCGSAKAAGHNFANPEDTIETIVDKICEGKTIKDPDSAYNGSFFGTPNVPEKEKRRAIAFLEIKDGTLLYIPERY